MRPRTAAGLAGLAIGGWPLRLAVRALIAPFQLIALFIRSLR